MKYCILALYGIAIIYFLRWIANHRPCYKLYMKIAYKYKRLLSHSR